MKHRLNPAILLGLLFIIAVLYFIFSKDSKKETNTENEKNETTKQLNETNNDITRQVDSLIEFGDFKKAKKLAETNQLYKEKNPDKFVRLEKICNTY